MSQTSASGSGGAVTPGWYTDPHDPGQLRWWSGEGWTEHVSPGAGEPQAAQAAAQPSVADQPLPSRRALRDPANDASEAAQAAQEAHAAQEAQAAQAAQQAAWDAQQAARQPELPAQQPVQPQFGAVGSVAAPQPSVPVPTLPVAPTSFLEQQGYAPLGGSAPTPPTAAGWGQPSPTQPSPAQPYSAQPDSAQPSSELPLVPQPQTVQSAVTPPSAWNQPARPEQPVPLVQPVQLVQPVLPVQAVQSVPAIQPVQPVQPVQPNAWNQPVQPVQPGWGAPPTSSDDIDSLFGGTPSGQVATQTSQGGQWGLTPSDTDSRAPGRSDEVTGSSSFWAWLIAISPILAAGSVAYVMLTTKPDFTDPLFEAAIAAPYLLVLLFALADRSVLLQLGHSQPRSPAWALLSAPIYLIARAGETRREDGSGTTLTIVWFVSVLVAVGGIVGYGFLTHHALIAGLPT